MDIIQEVGAYAGFAAVVGLAVLSALYFSQARDVRRLREWAGRAPERAAEQAMPGQTALPELAAQEAVRPVPSGAVRPIPAAKPASPATPAAAPTQSGDAPATPAPGPPGTPAPAGKPGAAPPVPATAAASAGQAAAAKPAAAAAAGATKTEVKGPATPATPAATPAAKPGTPPAAKPGPAPGTGPVKPGSTPPPAPAPAKPGAPGPVKPTARPPAVPAPPGPVARVPAGGAPQQTAVLPAATRLRDAGTRGGRARRDGLDARYIALIVAGVIVLGGAAAFGVSQLGGDDDKPAAGQPGGADPGRAEPVNPSTVTVSVLNGTTVPGLAAQIGDELESANFQRGNVANAIDQQRATSVVLFADGADREARMVARELDITRVEPIDPDSQALAGNASVVVVVGADQTQ